MARDRKKPSKKKPAKISGAGKAARQGPVARSDSDPGGPPPPEGGKTGYGVRFTGSPKKP